jgi:hypothetical protein
MFSVTSVAYNGKKHDHKIKLTEVLDGVESIENVVLIPFYDECSIANHEEISKRLD